MTTSPQRSIMVLRYRPYIMHPSWGVYNGQTPKVYNAMKNNFRPWPPPSPRSDPLYLGMSFIGGTNGYHLVAQHPRPRGLCPSATTAIAV